LVLRVQIWWEQVRNLCWFTCRRSHKRRYVPGFSDRSIGTNLIQTTKEMELEVFVKASNKKTSKAPFTRIGCLIDILGF
jgi:hypothetical protein